MQFNLTAHHVGGKSVSHPCRRGAISDPTEDMPEVLEADSVAKAESSAYELLSEIVYAWPSCGCYRADAVGSRAWWESVVVVVEVAS